MFLAPSYIRPDCRLTRRLPSLAIPYQNEAAASMVAGAVSISNPWCFLPHIESIHYPQVCSEVTYSIQIASITFPSLCRNGLTSHYLIILSTQKPGLRIASRIYSMLLAHEYKRYVHRHSGPLAVKLKQVTRPLRSMVTLRELDENVRVMKEAFNGGFITHCVSLLVFCWWQVTVPLGGFRDLEHYMTESSCSEYLENVSVPLLGINALVRKTNHCNWFLLSEREVPC